MFKKLFIALFSSENELINNREITFANLEEAKLVINDVKIIIQDIVNIEFRHDPYNISIIEVFASIVNREKKPIFGGKLLKRKHLGHIFDDTPVKKDIKRLANNIGVPVIEFNQGL